VRRNRKDALRPRTPQSSNTPGNPIVPAPRVSEPLAAAQPGRSLRHVIFDATGDLTKRPVLPLQPRVHRLLPENFMLIGVARSVGIVGFMDHVEALHRGSLPKHVLRDMTGRCEVEDAAFFAD